MKHNYRNVIAGTLFLFLGWSVSPAQASGPDFLQCTTEPVSLCVEDEGVRLPANNQLYLGEEHPDATSCSVHVTQKKFVQSTCSGPLQYEVQLFLNDTSAAYILQPLTFITPDSEGIAELVFNTEQSPVTSIRLAGIPYQDDCNDYHRIVWTVIDSCGQESSCTAYYYLLDCNKPLVALPGSPFVEQSPNGCQIYMYAKDFDLGALDDCSLPIQFGYSFSEDKYIPDSILECPEAYGVELPWKIWIADEGVDLDCDGQIEWRERNKAEQPFNIVFLDNGICDCGLWTGEDISGKVVTELEQGVKGVEISLHSPGQIFPTIVTESDGKYFFNDLYASGETQITAFKNDFHKNGVSTLDLVKIQKHLLGKEILESPYKLIAADANNSQNVSAIDLVEIRKLILGTYTEFPSNHSWRFIRADYVFQDTMDPWYHGPPGSSEDPENIFFTDPENPGNLDFIGIKVGDVNNSAQPNFTQIIPREALVPFDLLVTQKDYEAGEIVQLPIRISSAQSLTGFQFTLSTSNMEILDVLPGRIALSEGDFALFGDKMTISWFDENNIDIAAGDVLFTLVARSNRAGHFSQSISINSDITEAEIYFEDDQTLLPVLNVVNPGAGNELEIVSISPNPWTDKTSIRFYLPQSDQVAYHVIDVNGRMIYSNSVYLKTGYQSIDLQSKDIPARGLLFIEINAGTKSIIRRMMVME